MKENKIVKLSDVCDLIPGFAFKSSEFGDYQTKAVKIGDIQPPYVNYASMAGVDISKYAMCKLTKYEISKDDFVLAMTGATIGKIGRYISDTSAYINQRVLKFKPHDDVNADFIYYIVSSSSFQKYILNNIDSETAQPNISAGSVGKYEFTLPSLEEQNRIADVLVSIDSKIQINRQINDNLEQQAQALYKSWFVDFEPFKDGEFMDSELGLIPKGWQVGTYEQIIQTTISGDWGKDIMTGNYTHKVACVRGCDFQDMSIGVRGKTPERYILEKNYQAKRLIDNDVIVEISGGTSTISTGRVCLINADLLGKYNNDIVCTNFCKVVRPIQSYGAYLYYSWKYKYDCRVMFGYENGTSGIKNFQISDFLSKEPVIIPSESSIKEFQTIIDTLQNNIQTNGSEIMKLESLRDTLLPKLMSGELKINEIDC